jgi:succinate-semialdehyde dehydrogenase/glutarate-semialdehyde dehydrogenase
MARETQRTVRVKRPAPPPADRADAAAPAPATAPETLTSRSPLDGSSLGDVPVFTAEEVRAAVASARAAQRDWAARSLRGRCRVLLDVRDALVARADEIADLIHRETGKTRYEALLMEVTPVAEAATWLAGHAADALAPRPIALRLLKHRASYVHYVPRGVIGLITPWNFPVAISMIDALMALAAGNAVVIKPSEFTSLCVGRARDVALDAGLPRDLLWVVTGDGATGAALIDARVDQVLFTGSVAGGRRVAAACGERLIPCTVELGGNAPAVVCADADLERTARALVWGGLANQGQVCASVERVYVPDALHDALVDRMATLVEGLRRDGPTPEDSGDLGCMTTPAQVARVAELVDDALRQGAVARTGGKVLPRPAIGFEPTLLVGARHDMRVVREEIFGPVVPVVRVTGEDEAITHANDSHLGLCAYVFSRDTAHGRRVAERLEAGTVMVNDVMATYGAIETPWGGLKDSGLGFVHAAEGLRNLCQMRHVNHERLPVPRRELWWYPYRAADYRRALGILRVAYGGLLRRLLS